MNSIKQEKQTLVSYYRGRFKHKAAGWAWAASPRFGFVLQLLKQTETESVWRHQSADGTHSEERAAFRSFCPSSEDVRFIIYTMYAHILTINMSGNEALALKQLTSICSLNSFYVEVHARFTSLLQQSGFV